MADEPDSLILRMLREIREHMATMATSMATKSDLAELEARVDAKLNSLRADVASDMLLMRKELSEQIVGLRRAVVEFHSSVVGHGVLIGEHDERITRVEKHLSLPPLPPH